MSQPPLHTRAEPGDRCLRFRAGMLCCGVVTVFSLFSWRLIHLHYDQHEKLLAFQEKTHHKTQTLSASRGDIFDTRGRLLACDEPVQQVSFEMDFLDGVSKLSKALATIEGLKAADLQHLYSLDQLKERYINHLAKIASPIMGMSEPDFISRIRSRTTGEAPLTKDLSVSAALRLREALEDAGLGAYRETRNRGTLGALVFQNAFARRYPADLPLTHIVGFFGETKESSTLRGLAGAEKYFEKDLTGTPGERELEVDGWGNEIPAYRGKITPPQNGKSVRLTIDLGLQAMVERAMDEIGEAEDEVYLKDLDAERVTVVLFDPVTMGVRAIGCRDKKLGTRPLLINPVTELLYEPGSTMKIVTVAGVLSSGKVNSNSRLELNNGYWDDEDIEAITDEHPLPSGTVEDVLVHSSNIGAYKLARMMGTRRFEEMIRDFGFCKTTGFEASSESRGYFSGTMTLQTLSRVSYGMAIVVTPAQMCSALGTIINGGEYRPLHMAEAWVDAEAQTEEPMVRPDPRRVVSSGAAASVRKAMLQVVETGSGKPGRSEHFEIAGKTGTAWKAETTVGKDGKKRTAYSKTDRICSFIGFIPANKPVLGGLVIIDTPKGTKHARFGGRMAAPLFRRIAEGAMAYYQVPAQFSPEVRLLPQAASSTAVRATPAAIVR